MDKKNMIIIASTIVLLVILIGLFVVISKDDGSSTEGTTKADDQISTVAVVTTEATTEETTEGTTDETPEEIVEQETTTQPSKKKNKSKQDNYLNPSDGYDTENSTGLTNPDQEYTFRNNKKLEDHYEKHGKEMGFKDAEAYEDAASNVVNNPNALHKIEKEDGDDVYYIESTNEFVVVSTDGYIRTYFNPSGGIDYYNRQ